MRNLCHLIQALSLRQGVKGGRTGRIFTVSNRPVTFQPLLSGELQKVRGSLSLCVKYLALLPAGLSDPPPTAHNSRLSEQRLLNGQRVIASHVPRLIDALAVEPVGVVCHELRMAVASAVVQREF